MCFRAQQDIKKERKKYQLIGSRKVSLYDRLKSDICDIKIKMSRDKKKILT